MVESSSASSTFAICPCLSRRSLLFGRLRRFRWFGACGSAFDLQSRIEDFIHVFDKNKLHGFFDLFRDVINICLLYTSPSPRDRQKSRMPSSA